MDFWRLVVVPLIFQWPETSGEAHETHRLSFLGYAIKRILLREKLCFSLK